MMGDPFTYLPLLVVSCHCWKFTPNDSHRFCWPSYLGIVKHGVSLSPSLKVKPVLEVDIYEIAHIYA